MRQTVSREFAQRLYQRHLRAQIKPTYLTWRSINAADGRPLAVLGYRSAEGGPLFLESYLDRPVEQAVSAAFGMDLTRADIVEIGCLAALPSAALVRLWHGSALQLGGQFKVAIATLTEPLRRSFVRVGLPFAAIAPAPRHRAPDSDDKWGDYYGHDPIVCAGLIGEGATALAQFSRRLERRA